MKNYFSLIKTYLIFFIYYFIIYRSLGARSAQVILYCVFLYCVDKQMNCFYTPKNKN